MGDGQRESERREMLSTLATRPGPWTSSSGNTEGLVTYDDLASYEGKWMEPLHASFMGYDVYAGDGWSQGPRMILILNMLEGMDLRSLGFNTAEYIHLLSQVIGLAMSDSHKYVADPDVVDVPESLYSAEYAKAPS